MATIDTTAATTRSRKGFARNVKRTNLKVDMTPMVDLGFLLITFFIFTTSMSTPNAMSLNMPVDGQPVETALSGVLHILIGDNGRLYYYDGELKNDGSNIIKVNSAELRAKIIQKKAAVIAAYTHDAACEAKAVAKNISIDDCRQQKMMVLIKPNTGADYNSILAVMEEMAINRIARYSLVEPEKKELSFFK